MKDAMGGVGEEDAAKDITYRVYKRRWAMVVTVLVLNLSNSGMCFNLASVAYKAADYFEVTTQDITWFSQTFFIAPIALTSISTFIFNKYDMKAGIHVGSALNCLAGVIRAVATSGLISDLWTQYVVTLFGQVLAAVASLFVIYVCTKVAQNWFPDEERMMATTLLSFFPQLAISVAQVMPPLLVTTKEQIPILNYVYGGLAVLATVVTVLCVTRSRPPSPPSRSAAQGKVTLVPYLQQLKDTFTSMPFVGMLLMMGVASGFFVLFTTLSQQMLCSVGYSDVFSGIVVTTFIASGFLGSILVAVIANRTNAFISILKGTYGFATVFCIFLIEMYLVPGQHVLLIISSTVYGIFAGGAFPITLEMGVEITYPVEETISTSLLYIASQIVGTVMIYAGTILSSDLSPQLAQVEMCTKGITSDLQARDYSGILTGLMAIHALSVILFILFFRAPYKRQEAEKIKGATSSSFSNPSPSTGCPEGREGRVVKGV